MLHLWNKPATLVIDTDLVTAKIGTLDNLIVEVLGSVTDMPDSLARYEHLSAAIKDALADLKTKVKRPFRTINVVIADTLVYYDVLEIDARVISSHELQRLAGLSLADTLGLDASDLMLRCSIQKGGLSVVMCGIPIPILDAIKHVIQQAGYRLNRLEPAFAEFLNCRTGLLTQPNAMVAKLRHHSLTLGLIREGKWQAFANERLSQRVWEELRHSCDAFCSRVGVPDPHLLPILFDADIEEIPTDASGRWQPLLLTTTLS
ncbi:hypothetical protein [Glaciimonas immobilis]|uniref:Uncharacterized protein n=1 Tax=Glaciimonas immobilis TaxID=728004 RepID=A0A840RTH2_9BURK|nr:hypothetical protein [Glaciimonas immobilis]KAF3996036.1 hypothetical protein HAV38_19975 [Glaciimonas immobilis]MBB5201837.1 hypothetical protein [Glaciimonas immobilis]